MKKVKVTFTDNVEKVIDATEWKYEHSGDLLVVNKGEQQVAIFNRVSVKSIEKAE